MFSAIRATAVPGTWTVFPECVERKGIGVNRGFDFNQQLADDARVHVNVEVDQRAKNGPVRSTTVFPMYFSTENRHAVIPCALMVDWNHINASVNAPHMVSMPRLKSRFRLMLVRPEVRRVSIFW